VVEKVYADWRTAPVRPAVRAALGFIEKLIRATDGVGPADVEQLYAAGVSRDGLLGAVQICVAFTTIVRLADTFDFEIPDHRAFEVGARQMVRRGYLLP
jgi:alkylhydroperoxidase family enzyme